MCVISVIVTRIVYFLLLQLTPVSLHYSFTLGAFFYFSLALLFSIFFRHEKYLPLSVYVCVFVSINLIVEVKIKFNQML